MVTWHLRKNSFSFLCLWVSSSSPDSPSWLGRGHQIIEQLQEFSSGYGLNQDHTIALPEMFFLDAFHGNAIKHKKKKRQKWLEKHFS